MEFNPLCIPPFLTENFPGIGGSIKQSPEDFEVEEIPLYPPSGTGEFLYLWLEKRDMGAEYFSRQIARRLDIPVRDVGMAGLKDRRAVTRQMISVPANAETQLPNLEGEGIRLLSVSRHSNKLKSGHLRGNRFRILIRDHHPSAAERVIPIVAKLTAEGLPNFFGPQRFGRDGETVLAGMALLKKEPPPSGLSKPQNTRNPFLRKLVLSAAQAALFNHYLAWRLREGLLRTALLGDVMTKRPFGGLFVVTEARREQARLDAGEIVPTGPIFGKKMYSPREQAAEAEELILSSAGLGTLVFHSFGKLLHGTRRPLFVYLDDLKLVSEPEGLRLTVSLPSGSYATVLLGEIMKTAVSGSADGEELN